MGRPRLPGRAQSYLLAGLTSERALILVTVRDEGVPPEDPLNAWLVDLLRFPQMTEMPLRRLTRDETEEQLRLLLGGSPAASLVHDTHRRTDGNPYLVGCCATTFPPTPPPFPPRSPTTSRGPCSACGSGSRSRHATSHGSWPSPADLSAPPYRPGRPGAWPRRRADTGRRHRGD